MTLPLPGQSVRGSQSGRPIMAALDLLGRRGSLRVLWELRGEPLTFRALQAAADSNPAQLNTRLKELRQAQLVLHEAGGYRLSALGLELLTVLNPLLQWSERWAEALGGPLLDAAD